jgi:hypothetical protein
MTAEQLFELGMAITQMGGFTKNDIINAFLRAGVAVENVEAKADEFMETMLAENKIRELPSKPGKYMRRI